MTYNPSLGCYPAESAGHLYLPRLIRGFVIHLPAR
jgi:hypothetical protein